MSNQTIQRPSARSRAQSARKDRSNRYRRQTAKLEGRRDGKPLIFGWGAHLTRKQKTRIQQRAAYGFFGLIVFAILAVFVFGWIQQNVILPNQTFVSVNGSNVTQDQYRKLLAYDAQSTWNSLQAELKSQADLVTKVKNGDTSATTQINIVTTQIQTNEAAYQQLTSTNSGTPYSELKDNLLIIQGAQRLEKANPSLAAKLEPSADAITKGVNAFKAAFPANETYSTFLNKDNLTEADIRWAVAIHLRSTLMQNYQASLLVSPTRQVHLRELVLGTSAAAAKARTEIVDNKATWSTLAKQVSLDPTSKNVGGDVGWIAPGTADAAIEHWALATDRKVGDLSPVIADASGTFDVVQVLGINDSMPVNAATLSSAKLNALSHWLSWETANPANHISAPVTSMLTASRNMPIVPNLNATLPAQTPQNGLPGATGAPVNTGTGGAPGLTGP